MVTAVIEGRAIDVVYIAFSQAFDKILHGRLLKNIKAHGIHGQLGE